jgi:hypothetical protein
MRRFESGRRLHSSGVLPSPAVEHYHRCLYCSAEWFCHEACVIAGPAVCEPCRATRRDAPRRVIPLSSGYWPLDRLADREAERLRNRWRHR